MATATKIQLVEFNKDEALNGASLAFSSNGQLSGTVSDYVLNFQLNDIGSVTEKYSGQVQKKMYYFNDDGVCSDGNELHNLFIVDAEIIATQGTVATRGDAGSEETPPSSVDVDINNVTSTTDKLLYNMSQSMVGMQESLKDIKDTMSGQEGKAQKVELSAVSVSEVPVRVTNAYLNTYVDNMPTVPSEPVSITGTVSMIDNFELIKSLFYFNEANDMFFHLQIFQ